MGISVFTTASRTRRSAAFGAVLALFFSLLMIAGPAQAAIGVDVSTTTPSVQVGDTITLNWTSTDAVTLVAQDDWSGSKTVPNGTENITATAGTTTFTLLATDADGREDTDTVTVTVTAAGPTEVTPEPVTASDECTVLIPGTTGVQYTVTIDDETTDIDEGEYDGFEFFGEDDGDDLVTFRAVALDGFVLAEGAPALWTYDPSEDENCFGDIGDDELVEFETECSTVTFTNVTDETVHVYYGSIDEEEEEADGDVTIPEGESREVSTSREELLFIALTGDEEEEPTGQQIDVVEVPQDCGNDPDDADADDEGVEWPVKHPTRAPAAGVVADNGGSSLPVVALLSALALIAVRCGFALGR